MNPGLSVVTICGLARHIARQHASFMSCWPDTSGCVEHMYNRHTEMEEHTNVSIIHLMCRFITLCVADPIWGVCCYSYTLLGTGLGKKKQPWAFFSMPPAPEPPCDATRMNSRHHLD